MVKQSIGESRSVAAFLLNRQKMEINGQLHSPAALLPQKGSRYPLTKKLGESQNRCARFGEEILKSLLPRFKPEMVQPVAESLY